MDLSPQLVVGLTVCVVGTAAMYWSIRRKIRVHTIGRAPLDEQAFARLFPGREDVALKVRRALESVVPGDISLVRPSDRIIADLMVGTVDGLDTNQLREDVERLCQVTLQDADAERIATVADFIDTLHKVLSEQSNQRLLATPDGTRERPH